MAFREQLCSAVILELKWSNTKFVLIGPTPFWSSFGHVVDNIGEARSSRFISSQCKNALVNALDLGNICEYRCNSHISKL